MVVLEWAAAPLVQLQWAGQAVDTLARAQSDPAAIAAMIGPRGLMGPQGPEGGLVPGSAVDGGNF